MRLPLLLVVPPPPLSNPLPHLRNGFRRSATAGGTAGTNSLESFVVLSAIIPEFQQYPKKRHPGSCAFIGRNKGIIRG